MDTLVEASIISAHSPFLDLLFYKNRIGELVGVEYLSDESSYQEFGDLFAYGPVPLIVEVAQALLGGLRAWDEAQCMLSDPPWYARHVRRLPCKDIAVVVQEVDELVFLFGQELGPDPHCLG